MLGTIHNLIKKNKQHIGPALNFVKRCICDITDMRDKPNTIDYVKLGFSIRDNWSVAYNLTDPYTYFSANPEWKFVSGDMLGVMMCHLVMAAQPTRVKPIAAVDSAAAFIGDYNDVRFGWVVYDDTADKLYVHRDHWDTYSKTLEKMFWEKYSGHHVVLGVQDEEKLTVQEDHDSDDFLTSQRAIEATRDIQKFLDLGINRSIIFYGPPGSGKSNMVKTIASMLKLRTIRINNLAKFSVDVVLEVLRIFNPDAVILEDIDNVAAEDISDILDKIERFNRNQKITFATANQMTRLDEALIRPGRFDEPIEIRTLDELVVRRMTNEDEEIIELVKFWPAAYIAELMKRVAARGREEALSNIKDLTDRIENLSDAHYELKNLPQLSPEDMMMLYDPSDKDQHIRELIESELESA